MSKFSKIFRALLLCLIVFAAGCANIQSVLPSTTPVDLKTGYVAGIFTRPKIQGYAFVIKSVDTGVEYNLPLGEDTRWPTEMLEKSIAIKIPPGTYTVSHWITYGTLTKESVFRKAIENEILTKPFVVKAGSVTHLGSYEVSQHRSYSNSTYTVFMRIQPRVVKKDAVQRAFNSAYPNLFNQPMLCLLCIDSLIKEPTGKILPDV